jgi:hypothetical protein
MHHAKNEQGVDCLYVFGITEKQEEIAIAEIAINMGQVILQAKSRHSHLIPLFL